MPADPKLNEERLLATLRDETLPVSVNSWRAIGELVLMACYDRKVEREFFAEVMDLLCEGQAAINELAVTARMITLLQGVSPEHPCVILKGIADDWAKMFTVKRRALVEKFYLVTECPTTLDKVS